MNLADDISIRGTALGKRGGESGVSAEENWGCVDSMADLGWDIFSGIFLCSFLGVVRLEMFAAGTEIAQISDQYQTRIVSLMCNSRVGGDNQAESLSL